MYNLLIRNGKNKKIIDGNLHFDYKNGITYVLTKYEIKGILYGVSKDKYLVIQYLLPLDVFVELNCKNLHLNKKGLEFLYSINCYQIDDNFDLSLYKKIDIIRDDNSGKVIDVHYHNDFAMKDRYNTICHYKDGNNSHFRDKNTEKIKRLLNKNKL